MFCVNIDENIRQWYRLTRHLDYNSSDPYTCFLNPSHFEESSVELSQVILSISTSKDNLEHRIDDELLFNHTVARSSCDVSVNELIVSPTLLYNRISRTDSMVKTVYISVEFLKCELSKSESIPEILLTINRSSDYHVEMDFSFSLKTYLSSHRIYFDAQVSEGDVILVNLCELDRRRHFSEYSTQPRHIVIKFQKILKRSPSQRLCYIDVSDTRVELMGFQRDFVPRFSFSSKLDEEMIDLVEDQFERASHVFNFIINHWKSSDKTNYGLLLCGKSGFGQTQLVLRLGRRFSLNVVSVFPHDVASVNYSSSSTLLHVAFSNLTASAPCIVVLHDLDRIIRSRELGGRPDPELCDAIIAEWSSLKQKSSDFPIIICATVSADASEMNAEFGKSSVISDSNLNLPPRLLRLFIERLNFLPPNRSQRELLIHSLCERRYLTIPMRIFHYLSQRTAGFSFLHLGLLVDKLAGRCEGRVLSDTVCDEVLEEVFKLTGRRFRPADIPKVAWQDIGGLQHVIDEIVSAVQITGAGTGAGGILLYGPPGTGKTLLAKAVSKECNMNFISVKGPELLNMYVGQSEANVRDLFKRAREASPCIVFCDELDSLAPKRGRAGDSAGVMDRVVSQLMSEMEASTEQSPIQVIGATNRPDLLDEALLRPGRFDRLIYVGVSQSPETHAAIFRAQTRKFPLPGVGEEGRLNIEEIMRELPKCLTGADMYSLCAEAWRIAVNRHISTINIEDQNEVNGEFFVKHEDFLSAARNLVPSVPLSELQRYEDIRAQFSQ